MIALGRLISLAVACCMHNLHAQTNMAVIVRHAPSLNGNGRIEGSLQQLLGENLTINGGFIQTGNLILPGTPVLQLNGSPSFLGTIIGGGSLSPSGYNLGPSPYADGQAHHIFGYAEHQSPLGVRLQKWGIDLNSAENGIWLPRESIPGQLAVPHNGRTTQGYTKEVKRRLKKATDKSSAITILDELKSDLANGRLTINGAPSL